MSDSFLLLKRKTVGIFLLPLIDISRVLFCFLVIIKFIDSKTCAEHESLHSLISTLGREYFAENRAQSKMTKLEEKQLRG
jgi:hypothetical protein